MTKPWEEGGTSRIHDLVMAVLLYMPTLFFMPAIGYVLPMGFYFLCSRRAAFRTRDWLLFLFVALALVNVMLGMPNYDPARHGFMLGVLFIVPCMLIGRSLRPRVLKYLLYLTLLECITVVYEVAIHRTYLFAGQAKYAEDVTDTNGLLYYFRPYGLSLGSSHVALKIIAAIVLAYFLFDKLRFPKLTLATLYVCCFLNFNRTAMVAALVMGAMIYGGHILTIRRSGRRMLPHFVAWGVMLAVAIHLFGDAVFQLTRGGTASSGVLSGRAQIWASAMAFIREHPVFGNHSMSFRVDYLGSQMHCHNSYLQIMATHGLIGLILLAYYLLGIRMKNLVFVVPLLLFSTAQYGIFWNFSYFDVLFYFFINWEGRFMSPRLVDYQRAFGSRMAPPAGLQSVPELE